MSAIRAGITSPSTKRETKMLVRGSCLCIPPYALKRTSRLPRKLHQVRHRNLAIGDVVIDPFGRQSLAGSIR
jgi:hypothetical protein